MALAGLSIQSDQRSCQVPIVPRPRGMGPEWISIAGPDLWALVQVLRALAHPSGIQEWGLVVATERELAEAIGRRSRQSVRRLLRMSLAALFIRCRHRAVRAGPVPVRLPTEYWVLLRDPPTEAAVRVLSGIPADAVLLEVGIHVPAHARAPGYSRRRTSAAGKQLPAVGVVPGGAHRTSTRPEIDAARPFQEVAAIAAGNAEMEGSRPFPARHAPNPPMEPCPEMETIRPLRSASGKRLPHAPIVVSMSQIREQQHASLYRAIIGHGVAPSVAAQLLETPEGQERAARQLQWLPHRQARDPAAVLVAAIREDWPPPATVAASQSSRARGGQALDRLREMAREADRQARDEEAALAWLAAQPPEVRAAVEADARRRLLGEEEPQVPVPASALRAAVAAVIRDRFIKAGGG